MIDRLIDWSIRHRAWVTVVAGLMALWGLFSLAIAPIDAVPDLSENQVIVHAEWPDHGPGEIDRAVTTPLARAFQGLLGLKALRTSSDPGASSLWLIFEEGVGTEEARRLVDRRLVASRPEMALPEGVEPRLAPNGPATGQVFWYTVEGAGLDLVELRSIQDRLVKPELEKVQGVAEVASVGGMVAEVHVEADPVRMRLYRVSLLAIRDALHAVNAPARAEDLERVDVLNLDGRKVRLGDVATVSPGARPRVGVLEKDGLEVAGGVVLMKHGQDPLALTRRLKEGLRAIAPRLPTGVRVLPAYDRTPLIQGAVGTVRGTIVEAMICASICVLVVIRHARAAFVVAIMPLLSVLTCFGSLEALRLAGLAEVPVNIMSLAGLAISIGLLVDSAVVLVENSLHLLHQRYGDGPIGRDAPLVVAEACRQVGRPITFALLIMLISFLPVFALDGLEGKMFRPLAITKTLAVGASGLLAITLVPALTAWLVRGRARGDESSPIVRGLIEVYRPLLSALLDRPAPLFWLLAAMFILSGVVIGDRRFFLVLLGLGLIVYGGSARTFTSKALGMAALVLLALIAERTIEPLGSEFLAPLDERVVMDMPISVPGMTIEQGTDDLKARNMVLCRFPEVAMVMGKLGRAETSTDPAPLDMIETMVEFHPSEFWPARTLAASFVREAMAKTRERLTALGWVDGGPLAGPDADHEQVHSLFNAQMREYVYQRNRELFRSPGFDERTMRLDGLEAGALRRWREHKRSVDAELRRRAPLLLARITLEGALQASRAAPPDLAEYLRRLGEWRKRQAQTAHHGGTTEGAAMSRMPAVPPGLGPQPRLEALAEGLAEEFARQMVLRPARRDELVGPGGELDRSVLMPGWTNVWTMPIQNRVDMLATGVNTVVGVRVTGPDLNTVVATSERITEVVKGLQGASDVVADPIRGRVMLEVRPRRDRIEGPNADVEVREIEAIAATALRGMVVAQVLDERGPRAVRLRFARATRSDIDALGELPVTHSATSEDGRSRLLPLRAVAEIERVDGPATIKGEAGMPRNFVRLNVRGRDPGAFVTEARRVVASSVALPDGYQVDWVGQYEHQRHAARTLSLVVPIVVLLIVGLLYLTLRDWADALILALVVPGALAGGTICQWVLGAKFSVTVAIGTIACFGMATGTGVIMLIYLREAVRLAGGLEELDEAGLRAAVLDGAVKRLRPKLLTEATTLLGLVPMLWADGIGSEVVRPMAAPVLGGLLVADEFIDLLLPVLFHQFRRRRLARRRRLGGEHAGDPRA